MLSCIGFYRRLTLGWVSKNISIVIINPTTMSAGDSSSLTPLNLLLLWKFRKQNTNQTIPYQANLKFVAYLLQTDTVRYSTTIVSLIPLV